MVYRQHCRKIAAASGLFCFRSQAERLYSTGPIETEVRWLGTHSESIEVALLITNYLEGKF